MRSLRGTVIAREGQDLTIELENGLHVQVAAGYGLQLWDNCAVGYNFIEERVVNVWPINERALLEEEQEPAPDDEIADVDEVATLEDEYDYFLIDPEELELIAALDERGDEGEDTEISPPVW